MVGKRRADVHSSINAMTMIGMTSDAERMSLGAERYERTFVRGNEVLTGRQEE